MKNPETLSKKAVQSRIRRLESRKAKLEAERLPYESAMNVRGTTDKYNKPLRAINRRIEEVNREITQLIDHLDS